MIIFNDKILEGHIMNRRLELSSSKYTFGKHVLVNINNTTQSLRTSYTYSGNNLHLINSNHYFNRINTYNDNYKNNTINPEDKIYFSKDSSYPRYRLKENSDLQRTIKVDKSNKIVSNFKFNIQNASSFTAIVIEDIDNNLHFFRCSTPSIYNNLHSLKNSIGELIGAKIKNINSYNYKLAAIGNGYKSIIKKEKISTLLDNVDKIISEESLEKYISKNTSEMTIEDYHSISKYLSSSNENFIQLGLRMLDNYDLNKSLMKISLLFLFHNHNIKTSKEYNTVGVKNVRKMISSYLNFDIDNFQGIAINDTIFSNSLLYSLKLLRNNTVKSLDNEDEKLLRELYLNPVKTSIDSYIDNLIKDVSFLSREDVV